MANKIKLFSEDLPLEMIFNSIIIKGFDAITNENDISLLKLDVPVIFTDYIIPACLPTHDDDVMVGLNCSITGWGNTEGRITK